MRTLTDVFAPGAPPLAEGLRTLVVSPERELEPGITVRASFTFRNQGGAPATGVRVRFNLPEGLVYLVGSGQLDGNDLDDEHGSSPLLARAGADVGDIAPGEERRIDIAYSVAGAIENGSTVELQAAVATFELAPVGSNVVRLVARSRPALDNAFTSVAIEARQAALSPGEVLPGAEATVTLKVHNAGESSAHDVAAIVAVPEHTAYIPNSARVNGRELERDLLAPFDRVHAPIIAASLPANATVTLQYRIRVDDPLPDGTEIAVRAQIASQETPAFDVQPAVLRVRAAASFDDDRTSFTLDPASGAAPGSRVMLKLTAFNTGTAAAQGVELALTIGEGLLAVRGCACVDGRPLRERKKDAQTFEIGVLPARQAVEFTTEAIVASPIEDGSQVPVAAVLRWNGGERRFERTLSIDSKPYFGNRKTRLERIGPLVVRPADECEAVVTIVNDGAAAAHDTVLHVTLGAGLEDLRALDKNTRLDSANESVGLGTIEPYASRRITLRARVAAPQADRSDLRMRASLHTQELGETDLGEAQWRVDSHPAFSALHSRIELAHDDVFRPNQLVEAFVRLRNEGTDTAHNVRLRLYISPEARLESVDGATRERSSLQFGEIAPGATAQARLGVRLLRGLAKAHPVTIESVASADAVLPVPLEPLTIITTAEPNFAIGTLTSDPAETADAGEEIEYTLYLRNGGDGPARRACVRVDRLDALIYVPNSTTVNDLPVRDVGAESPLSSDRGIVLSDVDPGIEAVIRWREVVHNGLVSGESIVRRARILYDGDQADEIAAAELHVRCAPAFANTISGLPFGLDGMLGPSLSAGQRALPEADRFVELPPATPVNEIMSTQVLSLASSSNGHSHTQSEPLQSIVRSSVSFDRARMERALRLLSMARFPGLVTHLFALRVFFPDTVGAVPAAKVGGMREILQETLDRLFIRMRVPSHAITPREVETAATRAVFEAFITAIDVGPEMPLSGGSIVLSAEVPLVEIGRLAHDLPDAPLGSALPWAILARLLPTNGDALRNYRSIAISALDDLIESDEATFVEALQRRPYPVLDSALDVVCAQLDAGARA